MSEAKDRGFTPSIENFGRRCKHWEIPFGCCHKDARGVIDHFCGGFIDYCTMLAPQIPALVNISLSAAQLPQRKQRAL